MVSARSILFTPTPLFKIFLLRLHSIEWTPWFFDSTRQGHVFRFSHSTSSNSFIKSFVNFLHYNGIHADQWKWRRTRRPTTCSLDFSRADKISIYKTDEVGTWHHGERCFQAIHRSKFEQHEGRPEYIPHPCRNSLLKEIHWLYGDSRVLTFSWYAFYTPDWTDSVNLTSDFRIQTLLICLYTLIKHRPLRPPSKEYLSMPPALLVLLR